MAADMAQRPDATWTTDVAVPVLLVVMGCFVVFMSVFFWRRCRHIALSEPSYQYSQLSQNDVEGDLGAHMANSSSEDEELLQ